MDVGLSITWWLNLDNKVYIWNIKSSRSNVSSHKNREFLFLEPLKGDFSLPLLNTSMHNLQVVLHLARSEELIGLGFLGAEDNSLTKTAVNQEDVSQGLHPVMIGAVN